ncbi:MAG: hypothetical protein ABR600_01175 [Actinomycetota bacterium]
MPTAPSAPRIADQTHASTTEPFRPVEWLLVAGLALVLLIFFAGIYPLRGFAFPVGPDAPVYLWWTRLAAHDGLSTVGSRPGVPALALVVAGTLHLSRVQALAALGAAGGVCVGLAAAALVDIGSTGERGPGERALRSLGAGVLAGTFAAHLADGYFANLVQAALFLGAVAALATGSRRGVAGGAVLLAASALSHPQFFLLGCGILLSTAAITLVRRPRGVPLLDIEGGRILAAVVGAAAAAGAAFAWLTVGPSRPRVDTSQDAFLRRAGRGTLLHHEFRGRFTRHLARYVLPAQIPLGGIGLAGTDGFTRRFLGTWSVVLAVGVAGSLVTGIAPAVRFFAFGYVLPILAALGIARLALWIGRHNRPLAAALALALTAAVVAGATFTWLRARPFVSETELSRAAVAGRIAERAPAGTPIVVVVEGGPGNNVTFLAPRVNNVLRDAFPPQRIGDAFVFVGSPDDYLRGRPTLNGDTAHDAMSRLYLQDIERARGTPLALVLAPFNPRYLDRARADGDRVGRGVYLLRPHPPIHLEGIAGAPPADVRPSAGWPLALSCLAALAFMTLVGAGWARALVGGPGGLALAPVTGAAGLVLATLLLERLGLPLTGWGPPVASAAVAGSGYLVMLRWRRRPLDAQARSV